MSDSTLDVFRFIVARLEGDAQLVAELGDGVDGIYEAPAPPDATYPFVTIQHLTSGDTMVLGAQRVLSQGPWMIEVIHDGTSYSLCEAAYERVDALLQGAGGAMGDTTTVALRRESTFARTETDHGQRFKHLGGMYRAIYH